MQVLFGEDTEGGMCGSPGALVDAGAKAEGHGPAEPTGLDLPAMEYGARLPCGDHRDPTGVASP